MSTDEKVIKMVFRRDPDDKGLANEDQLVADIKDAVYSCSGKLTIASVFGCLKIAIYELEDKLL